jgi:hypothetical protein
VAEQRWSLADAVTWPVDATNARVRLGDRAATRLPAVARRVWPRVEREPAGSRLRRRLIERLLPAGFAALNAGDWDYIARLYDPEMVGRSGTGVPPDLPALAPDWASWREGCERAIAQSGLSWTPEVLIDAGGDLIGAQIRTHLTGSASGISASMTFTAMYAVREGRVVRQWMTTDDAELAAWVEEFRAGA